jgi:carbonic anhydrase/acetyltransferase-like protein (isoleucine patch superfamily)
VLTADGGPVTVGEHCVVMEGAVLRGTRAHPLTLGNHVLVGPHAYLTGCRIEDEVFIATGAMVFNGAVMGRASSVALAGAVHIGCDQLTSIVDSRSNRAFLTLRGTPVNRWER